MNDDPKVIFQVLQSAGAITSDVNFDVFSKRFAADSDYSSRVLSAYSNLSTTETDPVKKKEQSSQQASPSGTESLDSLSQYTNGEAVYGEDIVLEDAPVYPDKSFAESVWNGTKLGVGRLNKAFAELPRTLYSVASIPQNFIADISGNPQWATSYDDFLALQGMHPQGSFLNQLDLIAKGYDVDIAKLEAQKQKRATDIIGTYEEQGFAEAFEQASEMVLESLPITIVALGAGIANPAAGASMMAGLSYPQYRDEVEKYDELEDWQIDGVALSLSALEYVFEKPINDIIRRQAIEIFKDQGEAAAKDFVKKSAMSYIQKPAELILGNTLRGGISEWATTYSQNVVRSITINPEQDLFQGTADAFIVGALTDNALSTPLFIVSSYGQVKNYKRDKSIKKAIDTLEEELQSEDLPKIVREQLEITRDNLINSYNGRFNEGIRFYDSMESEDRAQVLAITKELMTTGRVLGNEKLSEAQREIFSTLFTDLAEKKAAIEAKYDSENQQRDVQAPEVVPADSDITFGTAFEFQDSTAEKTVSDKSSWGGSGLIRERVENAGDILRELSSRGENPDTNYIQEKINKLRSWIINNAKVASNAIPSDIRTIDDFNKTNLKFTNVIDGFEYLMRFNSDVVNKIKSEYEAIPTYTKEQKLAKDSVLALLNQDISGLEKNLDTLQDIVDGIERKGKLEIVESIELPIGKSSTSKNQAKSKEVEPTWFGKPMSEVVKELFPEEITDEEIQQFFNELQNQLAQGSMEGLNIDLSNVSFEDMKGIYRVARKAVLGETAFTDEEMAVYAENQEVIGQVVEGMKAAKEEGESRIRENYTMRLMVQKVLSGSTEFTDLEIDLYGKRGAEVDALVGASRKAENNAAKAMPEILRDIRRKTRPKTVAMTDKAIVRQRISDMIEGAKGALNAQQEVQDDLKVMIDDLSKVGLITTKQAASLAKAALSVNVKNKKSAQKFADAYERVVHAAERKNALSKAKRLRDKIRVLSKRKFVPVNVRVAMKDFLKVNPEMVEDVAIYIDIARGMENVGKTQNVEQTTIERILRYIEGQDELARAIGKDAVTDAYVYQQRLRDYLKDVISKYTAEQLEIANEARLDRIAEEADMSREELDSAIEEMSDDEIISGYYDSTGKPIFLVDAEGNNKRLTIGREIIEKIKRSLGKKGIDTTNMTDDEIQAKFLEVMDEKKGLASEKARGLIGHKLSTIKYDNLSETVTSSDGQNLDDLTLKELTRLNGILDNIIMNGSEANSGIAKQLIEKSTRMQNIGEVINSKKKVGRFSEKFFGGKIDRPQSRFHRFDQILYQTLGREGLGKILNNLGYNDYRVAEAVSDKILYSERVEIKKALDEINKKYSDDVSTLENQTRATILQLFVQARNRMNKRNEDVIVLSIVNNLAVTERFYRNSGKEEDVKIADTIKEFLDAVGKPKYVDNVLGFEMLDAVEGKARELAGQAVAEYVGAWMNIHQKYKPLYADYLLKYKNQELAAEDNYTAISIFKGGNITDGIFDDFDPTEGTGASLKDFGRISSYYDNMISTPKSKNFITRNRPTYKINEGEGYNMRFINVQDRAISKSVREAVVGPTVTQMSGMFAKNGVSNKFRSSPTDAHNENILKRTLAGEISAESVYRNSAVDGKVIQLVKNTAAPAVFGSLGTQFLKQSGAPLAAAAVRIALYNPRAIGAIPRASRFVYEARNNEAKAKVLQDLLSLSDVQQRDLTAVIIDPIQQLGMLANSTGSVPYISAISRIGRDATLYPLRAGDRITAISSYLAFLDEGYRSKYGRSYSYEEMLENPDKDIFAQASADLRDAQNVNTPKGAAPILRPTDDAGSFLTSSLLTFSSFAINFKAGIYNDLSNIYEAKDPESKKMAASALTSRLAEAAAYQAMLTYGVTMIGQSLAGLLFDVDEEYFEGLDTKMQADKKTTKFVSGIIEDVLPVTSNIPGMDFLALYTDDIIIEGLNYGSYLAEEGVEQRGLSYQEYNQAGMLPLKSRIYYTEPVDLLGKYTISLQLANDASVAIKSAMNGEHEDEYGNVTYYDEAQRKQLAKIGIVFSMSAAGYSLEEVRSATYVASNAIKQTDYSNEFDRYIGSNYEEDLPFDFMKEAVEETTEQKEGRAAAAIEKAVIQSTAPYSELHKKIASIQSNKLAGIFLYERVKGESEVEANKILGSFVYHAYTYMGDGRSTAILEQYIREKNRAEKLGLTNEQITESLDPLIMNYDSQKQHINKLDDKKYAEEIDKRIEELANFISQSVDLNDRK